MKPRSESEWITPAACGALVPSGNGPGAHLLHAGGEVGDESEQSIRGVDQPVQPRFREPHVSQKFRTLGGFEQGNLGFHR
jgi:hypothetical protein